MTRLISLCLALAAGLLFFGPALAQPEPSAELARLAAVGRSWTGELNVNGVKLPLAVRLAPGPDGAPALVLDSPLQGARGLATRNVKMADGKVSFELVAVPARFEGVVTAQGRLEGVWIQNGASLPLVFMPGAAEPPLRPQEPKPPLLYPVQDMEVQGAGGVRLACTLAKPLSAKPAPAVVLLTGSGAQDRNEALLDHKPFLVLSDALARAGVASLRCDDRGVGGSGGDLRSAHLAELAADAEAMRKALQSAAGVDAKRVGYLGHSEGGIVAPLAASRDKAAFVVLMAGPATPLDQVLREQLRAILQASGASAAAIEAATKPQDVVLRALQAAPADANPTTVVRTALEKEGLPPEQADAQARGFGTPVMRELLLLDPAAALRALRVPVLALYGSKDLQVPAASNAAAAKAALAQNHKAKVVTLEGLNHLFQPAQTGVLAEYSQIETTIDPVALDAMIGFITSVM